MFFQNLPQRILFILIDFRQHGRHGFKLAPAVGEKVAEFLTNGNGSNTDLSLFAADRFAKGHTFKAAYGGNRA